ncbi:N-acetylglucosamine-6-phosphate deacetylase [Pontibacillus sp. ALD_SL1]|uniref:N-acetylglucosamine-6-phosphate deacetylase n=1 Tax=Pontibacillus sp. ALD_SL1 TaxID=2777185 RepID=UPI001A96F340|nr:N-acetylglucosamine-6-phosphate deacetylase [Pontibacillus sp. ALD_SL1]QSS99594.1 N-acetylglucosamine-6-phosphate deacetylase [Pontibacillus sp. ALD_SL1]
MSKIYMIKDVELLLEDGTVQTGHVFIQDGRIQKIVTEIQDEAEVLIDGAGHQLTLYPGFIDVHIHGANGCDVMDGTEDALEEMSRVLPREGTTSFLGTTMTQSHEAIEVAVENAGRYVGRQKPDGRAEMLGIHLEGPFISKDKAGAQPLEHIVSPKVDLFQKWQTKSGGHIKLVTLAPEEDGALDFITYLSDEGVVPSIGHSNATFDQVKAAVAHGAKHVTHLFNQMSGLHHREPGVVGGALLHDELMTEMIVDGIHVHLDAIRLAYKQKGSDHTILITDAMRAKCLPEGVYDLGGQDVHVKDGEARLKDGTLAGSILTLQGAAKRMKSISDLTKHELVQITSENAAKQLGVFDRKGSIAVGKDADFVLMDDAMNVVATICRGVISYRKGEELS